MKNTKIAMALAAFISGAAFLSTGVANAADVYISAAHSVSEESTQQITMLAMQKKLNELSGGKIEMSIFPNGQMGGDRELTEGVQAGNLTITTSSPAPQANFVPSASIFDLPFAFPNIEEIDKAFKNPDFIKALNAEYEKTGLHLLGISNLGFRQTSCNFEINSLDDLKGFTIRTMENKNHIEMWRMLGANPTPIAMNELYTALQQGTCDGEENSYEIIYTSKLYEQQKYINETNHIPHCLTWIMNKAAYDALSPDQKKMIDEAASYAIAEGEKYIRSKDKEYMDKMTAAGITIHKLAPEDLAKFKEKVSAMYPEIKAQVAPEVYEAYTKNIK